MQCWIWAGMAWHTATLEPATARTLLDGPLLGSRTHQRDDRNAGTNSDPRNAPPSRTSTLAGRRRGPRSVRADHRDDHNLRPRRIQRAGWTMNLYLAVALTAVAVAASASSCRGQCLSDGAQCSGALRHERTNAHFDRRGPQTRRPRTTSRVSPIAGAESRVSNGTHRADAALATVIDRQSVFPLSTRHESAWAVRPDRRDQTAHYPPNAKRPGEPERHSPGLRVHRAAPQWWSHDALLRK